MFIALNPSFSADAVRPDELFGNGSFRDGTHVFQERSRLKVNIHAVSVAVMTFADKSILLDEEGELGSTATGFKAGDSVEPNLLGEA